MLENELVEETEYDDPNHYRNEYLAFAIPYLKQYGSDIPLIYLPVPGWEHCVPESIMPTVVLLKLPQEYIDEVRAVVLKWVNDGKYHDVHTYDPAPWMLEENINIANRYLPDELVLTSWVLHHEYVSWYLITEAVVE
jgi:hypothetical protein